MNRTYRYAFVIAAFALFSCRSERSADSVTTDTATPSAAVARTPTNVTVRFEGLICHVIDSGVASVPARAAVLKGGGAGTPGEHNLSVILPAVTEASVPLLDRVGSVRRLGDGRYEVTGIEGVSLRIEGAAPPLVRSEEWRRYVPSLRDASGNPNRFPPTALHSDLRRTGPPDSNSPFLLFFEYGGGRLTATAFEGKGHFDRPGAPEREFASSTALVVSTRQRPRLVATKLGESSSAEIEFVEAGDLLIEVLNRAKDQQHAHFHLFSAVSDGRVPIPPVRTGVVPLSGEVIGCADSTYP
jgi:hypothetical protein